MARAAGVCVPMLTSLIHYSGRDKVCHYLDAKDERQAYQTGIFAWNYSNDKGEPNSIEDSSVSEKGDFSSQKSSRQPPWLYGGLRLKAPRSAVCALRTP